MEKVAKIIEFSLITRIVVDKNATEDEMVEAAYKGIQDKINNRELSDNCIRIEDDEEVPYGEAQLDVYFQPDLEHVDVHREIMDGNFNSFDVFKSKEKCKDVFPHARVIEYSGNDIENPNFVDGEYDYLP